MRRLLPVGELKDLLLEAAVDVKDQFRERLILCALLSSPGNTSNDPKLLNRAAALLAEQRNWNEGNHLHALALYRSKQDSEALKAIDEAIRISNSTDYGLSSAVCTNRLDYITRFVTELNVGSVNIREVPGYRLELTPFGGIKDSGIGVKEGVQEAMKSFTNVKTYSLPW
jgi:hypothetical protein